MTTHSVRKTLEATILKSRLLRFVLATGPVWLMFQVGLVVMCLLNDMFPPLSKSAEPSQLRGLLMYYATLIYCVVGVVWFLGVLVLLAEFHEACDKYDREQVVSVGPKAVQPLSGAASLFFRIAGSSDLVSSLFAMLPMAAAISLCWVSLSYSDRLPPRLWYFGYTYGATLGLFGFGFGYAGGVWFPKMAERARQERSARMSTGAPPPNPSAGPYDSDPISSSPSKGRRKRGRRRGSAFAILLPVANGG